MAWYRKFCEAILLLLTVFLDESTADVCANGSSAVADCLHTYLERDFPSIEAIVYPKKTSQIEDVLLLDGPDLTDQCSRIGEVVGCLEGIQTECYYYKDFFPFRHLVTSLRRSIDWVCTPEHLRSRFRTLLKSFNCLETARQKATFKNHSCSHPSIPMNIWQRIIRLQSGTEVCQALTDHVNCTQMNTVINCPREAQLVYKELNELFLNSWCMPSHMHAARSFVESSLSSTVLLLITALTFINLQQYFMVY